MIAEAAEPRVRATPVSEGYRWGDEAVELAGEAGLSLDPWQQDVLRLSLGELQDDRWSAYEVGVNLPRQNGKGEILLARSLAGLFLLPERLVIHSAHQFDTSLEAFRRLLWVLEDNPRFEDEIRRVSRSHGEEGIELADGSRIRFRTRTKGGGRGFSADCLILDEAMFLPESGYGALLPILSARENPQVWYTGSAVDQDIQPDGVVFARVRKRGLAGTDPRLAYFEWSLDYETPEDVPDDVLVDRAAWAEANPALGARIHPDLVAGEQRALGSRTFAVERLGVGDWPDTDAAQHVIDLRVWRDRADDSSIVGAAVFTLDVAPDRSRAAIAKAGRTADGRIRVELVKRDKGTDWVVKEFADLSGDLDPVCDGKGPAGSLLPALKKRGVEIKVVDSQEMAQAFGQFCDAVQQGTLCHSGDSAVESALKGAAKRPLGDAWAWSRKSSSVDISPLVAETLALWAVESQDPVSGPLVAVT